MGPERFRAFAPSAADPACSGWPASPTVCWVRIIPVAGRSCLLAGPSALVPAQDGFRKAKPTAPGVTAGIDHPGEPVAACRHLPHRHSGCIAIAVAASSRVHPVIPVARHHGERRDAGSQRINNPRTTAAHHVVIPAKAGTHLPLAAHPARNGRTAPSRCDFELHKHAHTDQCTHTFGSLCLQNASNVFAACSATRAAAKRMSSNHRNSCVKYANAMRLHGGRVVDSCSPK